MSDSIEMGLVRCAATDDKRSELIATTLDRAELEKRLISESQQELAADEAKGLHLAATHQEHGLVTYLQQVTEGGFFVYVGDPSNPIRGHHVGSDDQHPLIAWIARFDERSVKCIGYHQYNNWNIWDGLECD